MGLIWAPHFNELVSAQATLDDQLIIWSFPAFEQLATLPGHQDRPLYMTISPDGQVIVTGSPDENLKVMFQFLLLTV